MKHEKHSKNKMSNNVSFLYNSFTLSFDLHLPDAAVTLCL